MKKPLLVILALAIVLRLVFAFTYHEVWWDSGVYIGMGKFLFSYGANGLWEHIRPPLLPLALGILWWIGLDPLLFGRLLEIAFFGGIVGLTFLLAKEWFGEKEAIWSSLIVALSPIFFYLSFHPYTEIPSVFFILLSLWLLKKHSGWAGLSLGLAVLSKFPAGIFVLPFAIVLIYARRWKDALLWAIGFAVPVVPYVVASFFAYGSPFATLVAAQNAISGALGCNVIRYHAWWYYFWVLVSSETVLYLFAIPGIVRLYKTWTSKKLLFVLSFAIPFLYLVQMHCRDYRYATLFIPFVAMLVGSGLVWLYEFAGKSRRFWCCSLAIGTLILLSFCMVFYAFNEPQAPNLIEEEYFSFLAQHPAKGEVWVSNPIIAAYTDQRLEKMYYPIYNEGVLEDFSKYLKVNKQKVGTVALENCGGGIICPPDEPGCVTKTEELIAHLNTNFTKVFDRQYGRCWYKIWQKST